MDDRSISTPAADAPIATRPGGAAGAGVSPLDDPRALTILTTEHWSLLSARSLVYNEAFARAGMFLALLSATLVALGLVATATGFSDGYLVVATILLALDLFVGLASLGRINSASDEDIRYLQGMNRIRHAYFEMVPEVGPYFITSGHDDFRSVTSVYGRRPLGTLGAMLHGLTTAPGMVAAICAAVAAALVAVVLLLLTHDTFIAALGGLIGFVGFGVVMVIVGGRQLRGFMQAFDAAFPGPDDPPADPGMRP